MIPEFGSCIIPKYENSSVFFWNRKEIRGSPHLKILAIKQHLEILKIYIANQNVNADIGSINLFKDVSLFIVKNDGLTPTFFLYIQS